MIEELLNYIKKNGSLIKCDNNTEEYKFDKDKVLVITSEEMSIVIEIDKVAWFGKYITLCQCDDSILVYTDTDFVGSIEKEDNTIYFHLEDRCYEDVIDNSSLLTNFVYDKDISTTIPISREIETTNNYKNIHKTEKVIHGYLN